VTIKRQTRAAYGCLVAGQSHDRGLSLQPIGYTPALSVTQQHRCSCSYRLWRYISVMPSSFITMWHWRELLFRLHKQHAAWRQREREKMQNKLVKAHRLA